tara:strand:- start:556 stop:828 length:273 start_codon:yes stop_codon:yes gene_type:complete
MVHKLDAIRSLFKGQYHKATADEIVWKDGHTTTDAEKNQIDAELTKLEALEKRKNEYGTWGEQLDYIYHNGITKWKTDHIKPIKDKYPKE